MASNTTPTPKALALGQALRDARNARGLSLRDLAAELGKKDFGELSRYETGKRAPKPIEVARVLTCLKVDEDRYDEIMRLAEGTDEPQWLAVSLPEQQAQLAALLEFELTATRIVDVSPLMVPGLLQTSDYARAIMSAAAVPTHEIETRVRVRLGRRDTITRREPVPFVGLVGEAALRQQIGSHDVMIEQLQWLLEMGQRPTIDLRVIPYTSGWHPALEGPFLLIESDPTPIVHLENRRSGLFLHEQPDVDAYRHAVDSVTQVAMDADESAKFIAQLINEIETAE